VLKAEKHVLVCLQVTINRASYLPAADVALRDAKFVGMVRELQSVAVVIARHDERLQALQHSSQFLTHTCACTQTCIIHTFTPPTCAPGQADPFCVVEVARSASGIRFRPGAKRTLVCSSTLFPVWFALPPGRYSSLVRQCSYILKIIAFSCVYTFSNVSRYVHRYIHLRTHVCTDV
jgi:hypothetical protein